MFHLEDAYWWYVGMRQITERLLERDVFTSNVAAPRRILDAGSGTGGSLQLLRRYGEVTAFDFEPKAAQMYRTREAGRIAVASIDAIPFADKTFDLVTAFDVVCQLPAPSDQQALRELGRVVKPGGAVLVRVPAFQFLYGPHDVVLHTSHRYSAPEMAAKLEDAGLKLVGTTYANTLLFPVALVRRLLARFTKSRPTDSDVRPVPAPLNSLLTHVLSLEAPLISRGRLPFGLSLVAIARRP